MDTLEASIDITARARCKGHEWSGREDAGKMFGEKPEEAKKLKRGSSNY